MSEDVVSPCIKVCVMDECSGVCSGCWRTLDEIAGWSGFSNDDKREILRRIGIRREAVRQPQQNDT